MRRLRDLEDSEDPAVAALARLFRSVGDLDPPPGADERVCGALAQSGRVLESGPEPTASSGTVYAVEPERLDRRALAVRPSRRRRPATVAAIAAGVAILAALTLVAVRPHPSDDRTVAPRPDVQAAAATDAVATTAPRTEAPPVAAESPRQDRIAVPPQPPPAPPPASAPLRTLHLRAPGAPNAPSAPGAPAEPVQHPPETAPRAEEPGPDGWTTVDAATATAAGVASGGHLITSRTGGPCRPGFICIYQRAQLRGVAYGVSLGASISNMAKLRCPGCANRINGNGETFEAQMSSWDNATDQRYCWYFGVDRTGKRNVMPPRTTRHAVPADNNDKAVSMGPCR